MASFQIPIDKLDCIVIVIYKPITLKTKKKTEHF